MVSSSILAISISGGIKTIGAYAAFAALLALALLALLYFAQARELKRLSEWAAREAARPRAPVPPPQAVASKPVGRPPVCRSVVVRTAILPDWVGLL